MQKVESKKIEKIGDDEFFLHPGGLFVGKGKMKVITLLGSCVGVVIFDEVKKIGGLNHFLLPQPLFSETAGNQFGIFAIPNLVEELELLGAERKNMTAKIYGGSSLLIGMGDAIDVGKNNILVGKKILRELGISIIEENVGGPTGRRICVFFENLRVEHQII